MKIVVLNGSPKGNLSISLAYFKYLETQFPDHQYKIYHIGQMIKKIEKRPAYFSEIMKEINGADGLVWVAPVYTLVVPYQLMKFIELVFEKKAAKYFKGKYATAISTSAHFYDHTAHNYLQAISEELKLNYLPGFSAEMDDLFKEDRRKLFVQFAEHFFQIINEKRPCEIKFGPIKGKISEYKPAKVENVPKTGRQQVALLTDGQEKDVNLNRMIGVLQKVMPHPVEVINIHNLNIKGGCLGCVKCGYNNDCVYTDDVRPVYQNKLMKADVIIFAGTVRHQFLSARWKMFLDRLFYNGHCPKLKGRKVGFLISGPLRQVPNLRQILEARMEIWKCFCTGFVTDEYKSSEEITVLIKRLAEDLNWAAEKNHDKPATFLGVGGRKVFRDLIYKTRFIFMADHRFYKAHDHYDFPQKDIKFRVINAVVPPMMKIPTIRKRMQQDFNKYMIKPFEYYNRK